MIGYVENSGDLTRYIDSEDKSFSFKDWAILNGRRFLVVVPLHAGSVHITFEHETDKIEQNLVLNPQNPIDVFRGCRWRRCILASAGS